MADKNKNKIGKYGDPIFDEYGRITGFVGEPNLSAPADNTAQSLAKRAAATAFMSSVPQVKSTQKTPNYMNVVTKPAIVPTSMVQQDQNQAADQQRLYNYYTDNQSTPQGQQSTQNQSNIQAPQNNSNWSQFVDRAKAIAQKNDFPVQVLLGQAALETGRDPNKAPGNNWFGIKGSGPAGSQNLATQEAGTNGMYKTNANFRAYQSPDDSIQDYINLIKTQYPQAYAFKNNPQAMIQAIHQGGYATDPNYANKVMSTPEFRQGQVMGAYTSQPSQPMTMRPNYGVALASNVPQQTQTQAPAYNPQPTSVGSYYGNIQNVQNQLDQINRPKQPVATAPATPQLQQPIQKIPTPQAHKQTFYQNVLNTANGLGHDFSAGLGAIGNFFGKLF